MYFFVPFRRAILFPVPFVDVSQERSSRIVQSKAGIYLQLVTEQVVQSVFFSKPTSSVSGSPALGEWDFHQDRMIKQLYSNYYWKEIFLIQVDCFD